ncbi:Fc.00g089430.m01.CDS01 [Cosmosporella sp. VM-42]
MASLRMGSLPSLRRQQLLSELISTGLKQACPEGIFVSLTPGDPSLWSGVLFVRDGPYAPAILRFQISFPDSYPRIPPLVTFATELFHPLITPLTTYMYTTDIQDNGTVSANDGERLPPGGFSLRHGFPECFGRGRRSAAGSRQVSGQQPPSRAPVKEASSNASTPASKTPPTGDLPVYMQSSRDVSVYDVLRYIRSTFDDGSVLDSVPLTAAGNPGAWHAWRTHRRATGKLQEAVSAAGIGPAEAGEKGQGSEGAADTTKRGSSATTVRQPGEWNWDGVWVDRVKKGVAASLSESVLYGASATGAPDDLIRFLAMEDNDVDSVKENLRRTLRNAVAASPPRSFSPANLCQPGQACVLVPHVVVTSEVTALETGQHSLWAAIEISSQLSQVQTGKANPSFKEPTSVITGSIANNQQEGLFEFGCLYDLAVDILPAKSTSVLQVLRERVFPTSTFWAGASILLLAQIQITVNQAPQVRRSDHIRQRSDDLIEDLEAELGDSQVAYMHVSITYSHSAFPQLTITENPGGVSSIQSKVETTATATLKVHNTHSPWSPPPAPTPNPLFELIEQRWSVANATEAMHQITAHRSTPRKLAKAHLKSGLNDVEYLTIPGTTVHKAPVGPVVPVRQASLQRGDQIREPSATRTRGYLNEMRRVTSGGAAPVSTMKGHEPSTSGPDSRVPLQSDVRPQFPVKADPMEDQGSSLLKQRSFRTESLRGLLPMMADLSTTCRQRKPSSNKSVREEGGRSKVRKDTGKWGWVGWF